MKKNLDDEEKEELQKGKTSLIFGLFTMTVILIIALLLFCLFIAIHSFGFPFSF